MACDRCDAARSEGRRFCPWCGEYLEDRGDAQSFLRTATVWTVPVVLALLIIEAVVMTVNVPFVFQGLGTMKDEIILLAPMLIGVGTISGLSLQVLWLVLVAAILASIAVMGLRTWNRMRCDGRVEERIATTDLRGTSMLFCASIALTLLVTVIQMVFGMTLEVPEDIPYGINVESLYTFADAAVWEEIITRVVYIGLPMTVAALACRRGVSSLGCLLGGFGMSRLALVLIVVSGMLFGLAHMDGWGVEKVLPTLASGILLGYAYVRYGLHVSILIHFLTDYLVVVTYSDGLMFVSAILFLAVIVLGAVCLLYLVLGLRDLPAKVKEMGWMPDRCSFLSRTDRD